MVMPGPKSNDGLTLRDFYKQYWRCRDFEIKNLWQRSIFLGTFLVLCFTGYGVFFTNVFIDEKSNIVFLSTNVDEILIKHMVALFLLFIGSVFSLLWIAMAKASKAWVEVYERAIVVIEQKLSDEKLRDYASFAFHTFPEYRYDCADSKFDCKFSSGKGGYFSPSRINILIGQLSLLIWMMLDFLHLSSFFRLINVNCCGMLQNMPWGFCFLLAFFAISLKIWVLSVFFKNYVYSGTLEEKDPQRKR